MKLSNNEEITKILCYWIFFCRLLTCDGGCVAAEMEKVKFSSSVSKSWDRFVCYIFIDDLLSVDPVTLSSCKAVDEHLLLHPVVLMKSINSYLTCWGAVCVNSF